MKNLEMHIENQMHRGQMISLKSLIITKLMDLFTSRIDIEKHVFVCVAGHSTNTNAQTQFMSYAWCECWYLCVLVSAIGGAGHVCLNLFYYFYCP